MNSDGLLTRDERTLIRSTAFAVLRNGTTFYEWLRVKRQADPSYVFLYGGTGSEYYEWCLANSEEAEKENEKDKAALLSEKQVRTVCSEVISIRRSDDSNSRRGRSLSRSPSLERRDRRDSPARQRRRSPSYDRRPSERSRSRGVRRRSPDVSRRRSPDVRRRSPDRRRPDTRRRRSSPVRRDSADKAWGRPKANFAVKATEPPKSKMYAWSDDEPTPSNLLRQKLAAMKQKLV